MIDTSITLNRLQIYLFKKLPKIWKYPNNISILLIVISSNIKIYNSVPIKPLKSYTFDVTLAPEGALSLTNNICVAVFIWVLAALPMICVAVFIWIMNEDINLYLSLTKYNMATETVLSIT